MASAPSSVQRSRWARAFGTISNYSLRSKIIIVFLVVTLISIGGVTYLNNQATSAQLTVQAGQNLEEVANSTAFNIATSLIRKVDALRSFSLGDNVERRVWTQDEVLASQYDDIASIQSELQDRDKTWQSANNDDAIILEHLNNPLAEDLRAFEATFPDFFDLMVTDKFGGLVAASTQSQDYYQADEPWWQETYNDGEGGIYISDPIAYPGVSGRVIRIAVPIHNTNMVADSDEVIGVLAANLNATLIAETLAEAGIGETGVAEMLLKRSDYVFGPRNGTYDVYDYELQGAAAFAHFVALDPGRTQFHTNLNLFGRPKFIGHAPVASLETDVEYVNDLGWQIIVHQDRAEALALVDATTRNTTLLAALASALVIAVGVALGQHVAGPIMNLTDAMTRFTKGDFSTRVDIRTGDETATLARRFNEMAEQISSLLQQLEQRRDELERRTEQLDANQRAISVLFAASKQSGPGELLGLVVDMIRDQFDLYHVQIYLLDDEGESAVLREGTGYAGRQLLQQGHRIPLDQPALVSRAIRNDEPVIVEDVETAEDFLANPLLPDTRSELVVPLRLDKAVIGALDAQSSDAGTFNRDMVTLFQTMAEQIAFLFENSELLAQVSKQNEALTRFTTQLRTAAELGQRLSTIYDPEELLLETVELIQTRFGFYHAHIYLIDHDDEVLRVEAGSGEVGRVLRERGHSIPVGAEKSLVAQAAQTQETILVNDVSLESDFLPNPLLPQTRSEVAVPLVVRGESLGVLDVQDDQAERFEESDVNALSSLAGQIATALENARLFEQLQQTLERTRLRLTVNQALVDTTTEDEVVDAILDSAALYEDAQVIVFTNEEEQGEEYAVVRGSRSFESGLPALQPGMRFNVTDHPLQQYTGDTDVFVTQNAFTDTRIDEMTRAGMREAGSVSMALFHLRVGDEQFGTISVASSHEGYFDEAKLEAYRIVAERSAMALREARLRERLTRLGHAVESAGDAIGITDVEGRPIYQNQAYAELFEYTVEELRNAGGMDVTFTDPHVAEEVIETLSRGASWSGEVEMVSKSGRTVQIDLRADVITDERDQALGVVAVHTDITERKKVEDALRESEERFRALFEEAPISLWEEDFSEVKARIDELRREGVDDFDTYFDEHPEVVAECAALIRIVDVNQTTVRLFEADHKDELLANLDQVFGSDATSDALDAFKQQLLAIADGETRVQAEAVNRTLSGEERYHSLNWSVAPGYEDSYARVLVAITDLTERRLAERALRQQRAFLRQVIDLNPHFIFAKDREGRFTLANKALADAFGASPDALIGKTDVDFSPKPEEAQRFQEDDLRVLNHGERIFIPEEELTDAEGRKHWLQTSKMPIRDEDGNITQVLGIATNITERKLAEEALRESEEQLRTAADVSEQISTLRDPDELLHEVVALLYERFDLYHAHVYLLDEAHRELVMRAGSGDVGRQLREQGHAIPLDHEQSVVARAARERAEVLLEDTDTDPNFLPNPLLPDTRSEVALPLISRGQELLGVLDVQDDRPGRFTETDVDALSTVAGQIAVTLDNARLFERLDEQRAFLRQVIDTNPSFIFVKDRDGRFTLANKAIADAYDTTPDEMLGTRDADYSPEEEEVDVFREDDLRVIDNHEEVFIPEEKVTDADGNVRWLQTIKAPIEAGAGGTQVLGVATDITERKEAEQALRESRERYLALFEDAPIALWEEDFSAAKDRIDELRQEGVEDFEAYFQEHPEVVAECAAQVQILEINETTARMYNAASKEELLANLDIVFGPGSLDAFAEELVAIANGDTSIDIEAINYTLDGEKKYVDLKWHVIAGYEDTFERVLISITDLTRQKKTEQALRESEERLRTLTRNADIILFSLDPDGIFTASEGKALAKLGLEPGQVVGLSVFDVYEDAPEVLDGIERALDGEAFNTSVEIAGLYFETAYSPVYDEDGTFAGVIGVSMDVTERQRLLRQLQTAAEVSEQISTLRDPDELLHEVVALLRERFDLYHAHVYLLDEEQRELVMQVGSGDVGRQLREQGHTIPLDHETSVVARAARRRDEVLLEDTDTDPNFLPNPLLPDTRSEAAVPLVSPGRELFGVLDVQDDRPGRFTETDVDALSTMASQIAAALDNARLFEQIEQTLDELRESESRNRALVEAIPDLMVRMDADGTVLDVALPATSASEYFFIPPDELLGTQVTDAVPIDVAEIVTKHLHRTLETGEPQRFEYQLPIGEGLYDMRDFEARMVVVGEAEVLTMVRDITEQKEAEQREERLTTILDTTPDFVTIANAEGQPLYINDAAREMLGLDDDTELEELRIPDFHPEDVHETLGDALRTAMQEGVWQGENVLKGANGDRIPLSQVLIAHKSTGGEIEYYSTIGRDITERKRAEEATERRLRYEEKLAASSQALLGDKEIDESLTEVVQHLRDATKACRTYFLKNVTSSGEGTHVRLTHEACADGIDSRIDDPEFQHTSYERLGFEKWIDRLADGDVINGTRHDFDGWERKVLNTLGINSILLLPIYTSDGWYGTIGFEDTWDRHTWNPEDVRLLRTAAEMIGNAIERAQTQADLERFANQLRTAAELAEQLTAILDSDTLLAEVATRLQERFDLYHVHVYLLDEDTDELIIAAGSGEVGRQLKEQGHSIPLDRQQSLVARAARDRKAVLVANTDDEPDFMPNPLLPDTRSEVTVPLLARGGECLGVLDVQDDEPHRFAQSDVDALSTVAGQIATALQNAGLFAEQEHAERTLRRQNALLEALHETTLDVVGQLDVDDLLESIVNRACALLDSSHGYVGLVEPDEEVLVNYIGVGLFRDRVGDRLEPGQGVAGKVWQRRETVAVQKYKQLERRVPGDDLETLGSLAGAPVQTREGVLGVLGVGRTLEEATFEPEEIELLEQFAHLAAIALENARLFEETQRTAERLREVDRLKSEFLANMSHELRTPLNSIIGYAEIMLMGLDGDLDEETLQDVQAIHENGQHLLTLINDILDLAKIEAGRMSLEKEQVQISTLLEEVRTSHLGILHQQKKDLELVVEVTDDLPPVEADYSRLNQVLNNLVSNAIKFTDEGSIIMRASADNGEWVRVEVEDTGVGISETDQKHIFERFRQVDGSSTRAAEGTGLGLAITHHLVEMHGGTIKVDSELGVGTTFTVHLPAAGSLEPDGTVE